MKSLIRRKLKNRVKGLLLHSDYHRHQNHRLCYVDGKRRRPVVICMKLSPLALHRAHHQCQLRVISHRELAILILTEIRHSQTINGIGNFY